jgi:hypothetical protein
VAEARLQVQAPDGSRVIALAGDRFTVGKAAGNDLQIDDPSTSRLHLVCERAGPTWVVTDAGSTNGTWVNGRRIFGPHALRDGDRVGIGVATLVFEAPGVLAEQATAALDPPPDLTTREVELLAVLCRPILGEAAWAEPASVRDMAEALSVSESAIKKALGRLYTKFGLEAEDRRRGRLATAAIRSGACASLAV